jgi:UDP-GlcNAc:undecaprenyl-phosphate GlcNAc-1-phosphate transferase
VSGQLLAALGFTSLAVLVLVPPVGNLARRLGAVAWPRSDRWHRRPVPTIGGLAIAAGLLLGAIVLVPTSAAFVAYAIGVAVTAGVGLWDDLRGLPPVARVVVEIVAGIGFVVALPVDVAPVVAGAAIILAALAFPLAMNATNLVDNADGLAAGLSTVTGAVIAVGGIITGIEGAVAAAMVVVVACLAFLVFNRPPASIFMGDSGSLALGFALGAASTLLIASAVPRGADEVAVALAVVAAAWAVQSGDVALVVVTRRRRGVPVFQGGVDHTSHRLMASGLSPGRMVLALVGLSASAGALVLIAAALSGGIAALAAVALVTLGIAGFERRVARIHVPELVPHNGAGDIHPDRQVAGS